MAQGATESCLSGQSLFMTNLRPKATKGFRFTPSEMQTAPTTGLLGNGNGCFGDITAGPDQKEPVEIGGSAHFASENDCLPTKTRCPTMDEIVFIFPLVCVVFLAVHSSRKHSKRLLVATQTYGLLRYTGKPFFSQDKSGNDFIASDMMKSMSITANAVPHSVEI
jgi:hypothetical protein